MGVRKNIGPSVIPGRFGDRAMEKKAGYMEANAPVDGSDVRKLLSVGMVWYSRV